jgi:hypothetical protein
MPISQSQQVYKLVKSLTKGEKRNFRLYAGRIQDSEQLLYIKLFDILEKQKTFDEKEVLEKLGSNNATQYSNVKRHLYTQILISLRHLYKEKKAYIKVREYIDMAYILYSKGLYMESLKILDKAKKLSIKNHTDFSSLTIVEIEKMIQSRHITRTNTASIEALVEQASNISTSIYSRAKLSNLKVLLHRYYIRKGHVSSVAEEEEITDFYKSSLQGSDEKKMSIVEKMNFYQCEVWYYYILSDFKNCYKSAVKWIELFEGSQELMDRDVDLYMRGYHYVLTSAFNNRDTTSYEALLSKFENFRHDSYSSFNSNSKIFSFLYVHTGRMNLHFLKGTFAEGVASIPRTLNRIRRYKTNLDEHKIMIIYFKIAFMYLGNNDFKKANQYLMNIINLTNKTLRKDMQVYARLMHLMVHYDMDSQNVMPYLLNRYNSYFTKHAETNTMATLGLKLFRSLNNAPILEKKTVLKNYLKEFKNLKKQDYSERGFHYLDIITWLEARSQDVSMSAILKNRN